MWECEILSLLIISLKESNGDCFEGWNDLQSFLWNIFHATKEDSSIKRRITCSNQDSTKNRGIPACDIDFREASRGIAMHHRHRICHRAVPRGEGAIGT